VEPNITYPSHQITRKEEEENWNKENKEDGTCIFNFVT